MNKIWPFTFYFLLFAGVASVSPFIVLYYQELGFTGAQIGLLAGVAPLITFLSGPLWAGLADATGRHRLMMSLAILGGVVTLCVFPLLSAFLPIVLLALLLNIFMSPISSFADSATMFMLAGAKEMYGRVRLGGTIGFGIAASVSGVLVQKCGLKSAFWECAALMLLGFVVSQKLIYSPLQANNLAKGRVRMLLKNPRWLLFLIVSLAGGAALTALNSYFFPYMKELGASESTMGFAFTVGTFSEIPVLFFGNRLIKRLKSYGLLMWAMLIMGIRLLLVAASGTPVLALFTQLLNGLTFPAIWMAGVSYADESAPAGMRTTAQVLFGAMVFGFGAAVGGFVGGLLLENVGGRGLYLVFGIVVLVVVAVVALLQKRLPAERGVLESECASVRTE